MSLVDCFYNALASWGLRQKKAKILLLGLDNARKAMLLHLLKDERLVQHQPTTYSTSEELSIGKIKFQVFDLGGHQIVRRALKDYDVKVDAVVYLVNADVYWVNAVVGFSDESVEGLYESSRELDELLSDDSLANVPFLVLGNSINIRSEVSEECLGYRLGLSNFTTSKGKEDRADSNVRPLGVFMCNFVRKTGYEDGFKWMSQYVK